LNIDNLCIFFNSRFYYIL